MKGTPPPPPPPPPPQDLPLRTGRNYGSKNTVTTPTPHTILDINFNATMAKKRLSTFSLTSSTETKSLNQMAKEGDVQSIRRYLEELGAGMARHHLNVLSEEDQQSPLHYAARYNHYETVKLLVDAGADVKIKENHGLTPLHFAARYNRSRNRNKFDSCKVDVDKEMPFGGSCETLSPIKSEEDPQKPVEWPRWKVHPQSKDAIVPRMPPVTKAVSLQFSHKVWLVAKLNWAMRPLQKGLLSMSEDMIETTSFTNNKDDVHANGSIVSFLVSRGAEVNCKDNYGLTPLHYAAVRGNTKVARDLIQCKGINIEARDAEDMTPLHLAAFNGNADIAKLLVDSGANLRSRDESYATPMLRAAAEGNLDIMAMLMEAAEHREGWVAVTEMIMDQDADENTALHLATENGHRDVVCYLVSKGANVNAARQKYVFPLHLAAVAGNVDIINILLESNERIDCLNADQETPLHKATEFNHVPVIDLLISQGAGIERKDKNNFTPLLTAASKGHVEAIECLLRHGADPSARDKDEKTAIYWAAQEKNHDALVVLMKDKRSRSLLCRTDRFGNSPLHIAASKGFLTITQCLLELGCPIELKNDEEQTALHLAAHNGKTEVVRDLLRHSKLLVNSEDEDGNTALHMAATAGHDSVIKALVDVGANVDSRNSHLWTPLDCASSHGHINSVKILLEAGSTIDAQDKSKTTSLHLAAAKGSEAVVLMLLDYGADVSLRDDLGRNCLEIAIDNAQKDVARAIVQSRFWESAMRSEKYTENGLKNTPLRLLIKKMPEVAEDVFIRCTETNNLPSEHPEYTVKFHYNLLDDTYITFDNQDENASRRGSTTGSTVGLKEVKPVKRNDYSQYGNLLKENHPLIIMVRSRQQKLLAHPLCISLLHLKWTSFGRYVYYTNLFIYLLFLGFLTIYILSIPPPIDKENENYVLVTNLSDDTTEITYFSVCEMSAKKIEMLDIKPIMFTQVFKQIIIALVTFHMVKELLQLYMLRLTYFGFENFVEWGCYISSLILVIDFSECSIDTGIRERWQWQVGAMAIFLAWINLVLFISKFPYLGLYVVMFSYVCRTFCKVGIVFFFIFVAFAMSYHTVMYYEQPFESAPRAVVRVFVMMLMEFQFDSLYANGDVLYPIPAYTLFVLLMTVVSLVIMNLLIGLTVQEIKTIQAESNLKRLAMQVELVLNVEAVLPRFLQERFVIHERSFLPNQRKNSFFRKLFAKINNTQALSEALASPEKSEVEQIQEKQSYLMNRTNEMTTTMGKLRNDNKKLENILKAILQHQGVHYEEDDHNL